MEGVIKMTKKEMKKTICNRIKQLEEWESKARETVTQMYREITGDESSDNISTDMKVQTVKKRLQKQYDLATTTLDIEHIANSVKEHCNSRWELAIIFEELFGESIYDYRSKSGYYQNSVDI